MFDASEYWITVVELPAFEKATKGLLTDEELEGLLTFLACHPDEGDVIPATGGLRKIRWGARGKGKRGGARIIYYFRDLNMPLYLITAFGKGEKIDLSQGEKAQMRHLVDLIVDEHWTKQVSPRLVKWVKP